MQTLTLERPEDRSEPMSPAPPLRARQIGLADLDKIAALLAQGYPTYSQAFWRDALAHMGQRPVPADYPQFGFMLDRGGDAVGVILTLFTAVEHEGGSTVRCNVSSWYVDPACRGNGAPLLSQVFRYKAATVLNTSALPHTWKILQHQGYRRYSEGQMVCVPALSPPAAARVRRYRAADAASLRSAAEAELMAYHAAQGCVALVCQTRDGLVPLVFLPRKIFKLHLPYAQLCYCRDTADFVRFAGPVGRWLLRHGYALAVIDAQAPVPALVGRFMPDRVPKFYRGPVRPRLNDLAYTEGVVLRISAG
jgi:hypothetical protein